MYTGNIIWLCMYCDHICPRIDIIVIIILQKDFFEIMTMVIFVNQVIRFCLPHIISQTSPLFVQWNVYLVTKCTHQTAEMTQTETDKSSISLCLQFSTPSIQRHRLNTSQVGYMAPVRGLSRIRTRRNCSVPPYYSVYCQFRYYSY